MAVAQFSFGLCTISEICAALTVPVTQTLCYNSYLQLPSTTTFCDLELLYSSYMHRSRLLQQTRIDTETSTEWLLMASSSSQHPRPLQFPLDVLAPKAQCLGQSACSKHSELCDLVNKYGLNIERRWVKNYPKEAQRAELLKGAYPDIPISRHISTNIAKSAPESYRVVCLYPAINVEDLVKSDVATQFMYCHAEVEPLKLVYPILEHTSINQKGHEEPVENMKHVMAFNAKIDGGKYVKLVTGKLLNPSTICSLIFTDSGDPRAHPQISFESCQPDS